MEVDSIEHILTHYPTTHIDDSPLLIIHDTLLVYKRSLEIPKAIALWVVASPHVFRSFIK